MLSRSALAALGFLALAACDDGDPAREAPRASGPAPISVISEPPSGDRFRRDDLVVGAPDAPVLVVVFESVTCRGCARFDRTAWPALKSRFVDTGQVAFVFLHRPINRGDLAGATLAGCLPAAQRYAFRQQVFERQSAWADYEAPPEALADIAAPFGLPRDEALACMADEARQTAIVQSARGDALLRASRASILSGGLLASPSFAIGDDVVFRYPPDVESFSAELERRLDG